jgi:hypothetical protein
VTDLVEADGPIFVVGQPRSGSTITTRVLNEAEGLFIINDFYVLQSIDAAGLWAACDSASAKRIAELAYERIAIRATQEDGKTLNQSIDLSHAAVAELKEFCLREWEGGLLWHEVLGQVMTTAANLAGCRRWGWNTPQDHLHLDRLFAAYPSAKALFVLRAPSAVLCSYKNVTGPWHDARRYNPITIGIAWKAAAEAYKKYQIKAPGRVMLLRYEGLVRDTSGAISRLREFFGLNLGQINLESFGRNSSFAKGQKAKQVGSAEIWTVEKVIGSHLEDLGFERTQQRLGFAGLRLLAGSLLRSAPFLASQILFDKDRRRRAFVFIGRG